MADFVKSDNYTLKNEYSVNYNNGTSTKKYKAILMFIGSKAECEEQENFVITYSMDQNVISKKNKSQTQKTVQDSTNEIREENRTSLLESEIAVLKEKLKETEIKLKESEVKIVKLEQLLSEKNEIGMQIFYKYLWFRFFKINFF